MSAEAAREVVEAFFRAFNARDQEGLRRSLHFPHVRLASGRVRITERPEDFSVPFEALASSEGWDHSSLDEAEVVHDGPDKVHLAVSFTRYTADDTSYATHRSLWVITRADGQWGIQARSSFAP